ncbi:hypothetical protein QTH90_10560 [Variovorax sp. J2P1-59]|uniref:hypothetical protein n=1 Tax=Variovorax flavidus TaxID=3053501 RepID=UPI002574D77C|nr:hypothetical protein [Variovorax sp. J2P1-59]MDM0074824.1 hypothetical protein [Variovorax sp. J2P1-59]
MKIAVAKTRGVSSFTQQDSSDRHLEQDDVPQTGPQPSRCGGNLRESLWSRFSGWVYAGRQPQDMTLEWSCCGTPTLDPDEAYLGRVESSELSIDSCAHCGMLWLSVRSVATTVTRTTPLSPADAEAFLAAAPGFDRREIMRAWLLQLWQQARTS